ncbi:DUF4012 domain-containing protein [Leifsonia sp. NPDC080035]|uniref:DUF4012 domain-containing protein n=1 Tax=Leifsonia sp. NPDC080035 TaxID=3143936 RepID=A0AAU7G703_9MICO
MAIGLSREQAPPRAAEYEPVRRRRRPVLIAVIVVLAVLLAAFVGWIGIRALLARQQLEAAQPSASAVVAAIRSGDVTAARSAAGELSKHAAQAASLTGDPIWRLGEGIPLVGPNLAAVRVVASATDSVAREVVAPLVSVSGQVDPRSLKPAGGRIDLAPLVAARPVVTKAQAAFHAAAGSAAGVSTASLIQPVGDAVSRLNGLFGQASPSIDAIGNSTRLLPGMLGQAGVRNILVVAQNPAELRATGGLIGSVALIRADHGAVTLEAQQAGTSIGPWPSEVSDIPDATIGIYGPLVGRFLQDANYTPDFPLAATTIAAMWEKAHGGTVDAVITMDPVVLSALLKATGPVALPSGDTITSANAVPLLLSEVYARYPASSQQDAFFSSAAAAIFGKLAAGHVDGEKLLSAFSSAGSSDRLRIWSAHADEQDVLASTTLAGALPVSTPQTAALGVYLNDATGSKMDYYLHASVSAGAEVCRFDFRPTSLVRVTLTNHAPANAGTSLPTYVTGGGTYGVPPGEILTRVVVYGPAGGLLAGTRLGSDPVRVVSGTDRARPVAVVSVQLKPGESKTVTVQFVNARQLSPGLTVATTPLPPGAGVTPDVGARTTITSIAHVCDSLVK